jgi:hypothetical protein
VINAKFEVILNHYKDIVVRSLGGDYTLCKIKVVSNGNEDASVYFAANNTNNNNCTCTIQVEGFNDESFDMAPSTAYSTVSFEHEAIFGESTTSSNTMASGTGATNGYSV